MLKETSWVPKFVLKSTLVYAKKIIHNTEECHVKSKVKVGQKDIG